jgi:hypothetical protein
VASGGNLLSLIGVGDTNADGFDDLIMRSAGAGEGIHVFHGPLTGSFESGEEAFRVTWDNEEIHEPRAASAGQDLDGDGIGDLVLMFWEEDNLGALRVFSGPITDSMTIEDADVVLRGGDTVEGSYNRYRVGDLTCDGLGDMVVAASPDASTYEEIVHVYTATAPLVDAAFPNDATTHLSWYAGRSGTRIATGGDLDGDGCDDLVSGYYVFTTVPAGDIDPSAGTVTLTGLTTDYPETAIHGDVDGDGQDDLVIGDEWDAEGGTDAGAVFVVLGGI